MSSAICRIVRDESKQATSFSFDPAKLVVTEARKLNKGKFSNVRYSGGALYIETPMLHSPMSVSSFEDEGKKSIFVSCRGHDDESKPEVKMFADALMALQDRVVDQVSSMKMLGTSFSRDTVAGVMSPLVKLSDEHPPAFRVNLPFRDGKACFDMYKKNGKSIDAVTLDDIDIRGASIKVIFTITSVWVINKTWGISTKATQVLVKPAFDVPSAGLSCFSDLALEDSDEDDARVDQIADDED